MRCMSCLDCYPRNKIKICHGCKAWYCPECSEEHTPCNKPVQEQSHEEEMLTKEEVFECDPRYGMWVGMTV